MSTPQPRNFTPEIIERAARNVHTQRAAEAEEHLEGKEARAHAKWLVRRAFRLAPSSIILNPVVLCVALAGWVAWALAFIVTAVTQ